MAGFSKYLAGVVLNHVLVNVPMPEVASRKIALFTADPLDDIASEVGAAWYSRQTCNSWSPAQQNAVDGLTSSSSNAEVVTFGPVSGGSIQVSHWGIVDALNANSLFFSGAITGSPTLTDGDTLVFDIGDLAVTLS